MPTKLNLQFISAYKVIVERHRTYDPIRITLILCHLTSKQWQFSVCTRFFFSLL